MIIKRKIGFEIKLLDNMLTRRICANVKMDRKYNISHVQFNILKYLFQNNNKVTYQSDLEKMVGVRRSTISGILKTMEKNGLVERIDSPLDARKKELILTSKSLEKSKEMQKSAEAFEHLLSKNISYEELTIFFNVIDKIKKNIG